MRTLIPVLLVSVTVFSALFAQAPSSNVPRLHLNFDGHACSGSLRVTATRLHWKSAFSLCDTRYSVLAHAKGGWTLELQSGPASARQSCPFRIITLRPIHPDLPYPEWEVAGFKGMGDVHASPPNPSLDCPMQNADAR
jgi:hypothetical protein